MAEDEPAISAPTDTTPSESIQTPQATSESATVSEPGIELPPVSQTAQTPASEPFDSAQGQPPTTPPEPIATPTSRPVRDLLAKARLAIQGRKQKKLEKVLALFEKRRTITNDEVEKLLHVSDATATRYLTELERQGKIAQVGKTGKAVTYTKI